MAVVGAPAPAAAQAKAVPIDAAAAGIDRLYEDLDYIFGLASEPNALKELKETLDVYFEGVDRKAPAVFQIYVRKGKFNIVLHTPILNMKKFRDNLRQLGVKTRVLGAGLYQIGGLFNGFLKEAGNIAIIAEAREDTTPIGKLSEFKAKLSKTDHDGVVVIANDASQIKEREDAIEDLRTQVMPGLKKLKNETDTKFKLRKLTLDQQLTELKQVYGQAKHVFSYVDVSSKEKTLLSSTSLTALPDTQLAKGIDNLAKDASYFANIELSDKLPLSGMINFKLDELRQKHMKNFLAESRPIVLQDIKDGEGTSGKTKEYVRLSTEIIFDVLEKSTENGLFDSFVNVYENPTAKHTLIGGSKVDGAVVKSGLEKLKAATTVEMNTGKVGEVELHKVTLPGDLNELHDIFGKELVLVVGTSSQAVWYAIGENAEGRLKEAIELATKGGAAATNKVVYLHGKALIWYELFDANRTKHKKGDEKNRKEAIEAFKKGDDIFDLQINKAEGGLHSTLTLHEGILRYFGKVGARFVRENLQQ